MRDLIDELIDEVTFDIENEDEKMWAFREAFELTCRFPFAARVVGADLEVAAVGFEGDMRRGLLAMCRRAGEHHTISLLEVTAIGPLPLATGQLLEAYRRWSRTGRGKRWVYPRFAAAHIDMAAPLALKPEGDWNPAEEYWGERGDPLHPLCREVIATGVRPCFEMDQVLPGVKLEEWDRDPIVDAADLHRAGHHGEAVRALEGLLALDNRCIDAWGHLGLVAFDTRGPAPAVKLYQIGVAVAEQSLPDGFGGVLPWGMVDNRPFLRCLHGLALCAWRQRRWDDAAAMFTAQVWLNPSHSLNALACLEPVLARRRWTP